MIVWNPNFETGHPDIDREHREICERLNEIEVALETGVDRDQIAGMVSILQRYTHVHFRREETAMACAKCPRHDDNCAAHARFSARLERWLEVLTIPDMPVDVAQQVHAESCRWIQQHLLQIDSNLRQSQPA